MTAIDTAALWHAVARRDTRADGLFVYAVQSTRIYCRPSCPSRRPSPDKVAYFPTSSMAAMAGYRACRRCRPERAVVRGAVDEGLARVCRAIASAPERRWTSARMSTESRTTAVALRRAFRRVLGIAPRDYVAACRRRNFLGRLQGGEAVTDAMYAAGYSSPSGVYGVSAGEITPASYRRGADGVAIDWTTVPSPIGRVLVAATAKGVCFVAVGANDRELEDAIRVEFPKATIARSTAPRMHELARAASAVAEGRPIGTSVPADIAGTAFQWRVWRALSAIRPGRPITYAKLAESLGQPRAVRAVARACATNPLALIVPCHRVVGSDGTLRGYRWGLPVKQALLTIEGDRAS